MPDALLHVATKASRLKPLPTIDPNRRAGDIPSFVTLTPSGASRWRRDTLRFASPTLRLVAAIGSLVGKPLSDAASCENLARHHSLVEVARGAGKFTDIACVESVTVHVIG